MPIPAGRSLPVIRVAGPPEQRGRAYGTLAAAQINRSIAGYERVFRHHAGWDWSTVRTHAARFAGAIEDFSPASMRELRGIAEGAGVTIEDVIALNTRSEIMFAAPGPSLAALTGECTSFAVLPERSAGGRIVAGQNWDWLEHARETALVLEVRRDDGPDFVTLVEAGLLAKVGLNSSGVGLCTNTLIGDGDEGRVAVPYHLLLRSVLDSESGADAADRICVTPRANSANYLIVDDTGFCVDLETTPATDGVRALHPVGGTLVHSNHFLGAGLTATDRYLTRKPHSTDRLRNLDRSLRDEGRVGPDELKRALADHTDYPDSVCQHPRESVVAEERTCTVAAVLLDVTGKHFEYAGGNPCETPFETVNL